MHFTDEQWALAKQSLRQTLPQGAFNQWLAHTELQAANGNIRIAVKHETQRDWLEHRLKKPVLQALNGVSDETITAEQLFFVVDEDSPSVVVDPKLSLPDFYAVWKKTGYSPLAHYVTRFWLPYLKPTVFAVWKALESTDTRPVTDIANRWSKPREYTYRQLARMVGAGSHKSISGRKEECGISRDHRRLEKPITNTCAQCPHSVHQLLPDAEGDNRCKYWRPGALEILFREGLLSLNPHYSAQNSIIAFTLSIYRVLPLLTPAQIDVLSPSLRREHKHWLRDYEKTTGLGLDVWQSITASTLVTRQAGYTRYTPLTGTYQFNRILAEIAETDIHESNKLGRNAPPPVH